MPSIVIDGRATPILHVSQLCSLLGLPEPEAATSTRLAWDTVAILRGWLDHLPELDWRLLVEPTPSRGRSLRNLTVNVFRPFGLLPGAWETGRFDWDPDEDDELEARLTTTEEVVGFAERIFLDWNGFVLEAGEALELWDPVVRSPRGELAYSALLASQRWHAGFHYRQLTEFLRTEGVVLPGGFAVESLADLRLPAEVFELGGRS